MHHVVVKLLERFGRFETGFGLGTPDLAAASKLVTDEGHRDPGPLGAGRDDQRRRYREGQATRDQQSAIEHATSLNIAIFHRCGVAQETPFLKVPSPHRDRHASSPTLGETDAYRARLSVRS
ncbi:MAG TPA: hypothetical protein VJR58_28640, partial [Vineibacter sp.]|nr:hypothetical protein [Vineibacter sp.]